MGSRNFDGSLINQPDFRLRHKGAVVEVTSVTGVDTTVANTDTSVEIQKYTEDSTANGSLSWQYTRKISGIHTSVSTLRADPSSQSRANTHTERKIFFTAGDRGKSTGFDDWTIFDSTGEAVGATTGTTDTDITPTGTFDERPSTDG